ncbi:hypothetical protein ABIB48_002527 [Arthrobacter sp. UYCu511]
MNRACRVGGSDLAPSSVVGSGALLLECLQVVELNPHWQALAPCTTSKHALGGILPRICCANKDLVVHAQVL